MFTFGGHRHRAYHRHRGCRHQILRRRDCRRNLPCWMNRDCCWNGHRLRCSRPTRRQIRRDYPSKMCCRHCDCLLDHHRRLQPRRDCQRRLHHCDCRRHRHHRDYQRRRRHRHRRDCQRHLRHQHRQAASCCRDFRLAGQHFAAQIAGDCLVSHRALSRRICLP